MRTPPFRRGFTLIELLVVVSIISLLSSVAMSSLGAAREKARITKALQDLRQVTVALAAYHGDFGSYPNSFGGTGSWDGLYTCWGDASENWIAGLNPTYMSALPRSPNNSSNCGDNFIYRSDGNDYKLIWHNPENCAWVKSKYPTRADPNRDCWAYGFWTPGAVSW